MIIVCKSGIGRSLLILTLFDDGIGNVFLKRTKRHKYLKLYSLNEHFLEDIFFWWSAF